MKVRLKKLTKYDFDKIKIPGKFRASPPNPEKLIHKMLVFSRESELDDIIVDKNMYLINGYCSYLIAQQVGVEFVKIKQVRGVAE